MLFNPSTFLELLQIKPGPSKSELPGNVEAAPFTHWMSFLSTNQQRQTQSTVGLITGYTHGMNTSPAIRWVLKKLLSSPK